MPSPRGRAIALAVVFAAYVLSFFHRFAPAVIAQDLASAFGTSATALGVLAATYFYVYTAMQIPTGVLVDTLGPRRILVAGGVIAGAGSLLFAQAEGLNAALVGRTLVGLGVSVTFVALLKLVALWYDDRHFASLTGLALLLGNFGSILAGTPLALLAEASSWRSVFIAAGIASLVLAAGMGLALRGETQSTRPGFDRTVVLGGLWGVLRNRATWPAVAFNTGIAGSFFAFGGLWAAPWLAQVHGYGKTLVANHLSLYFAGFALGCFVVGNLSDRLRRRRPVAISGAALNVGFWLLWLSAPRLQPALSLTGFFLMGASTGCVALSWACAKEVNPPHLSGMSTSVTNLGSFLGAAVLQPLVGYVVDRAGAGAALAAGQGDALSSGLLPLAAAAVLGLGGALCLRETGCRNIWKAPSP